VDDFRTRLARARLMLLFTPDACRAGEDPLDVLARALPHVDALQVRIKDRELGLAPARAVHAWALRVLELVERVRSPALVFVDDRVDVAAALLPRGLAGVHLGQEDAPATLAREVLGQEALVGLSTHTASEVACAEELPVDYLGFGPVHPTRTKGIARGLGAEAAWVAARASSRPVFPIGGITPENAAELAPIGRAAVSAAILEADDPAAAARAIRALLEE
jgi:thiamine-phosphate pyrophosphorylase